MSDTQPTTVDEQAQEATHDEEATLTTTVEDHPAEDNRTTQEAEDTSHAEAGDDAEKRQAAIARANREAAKYRTRLREAEQREKQLRESVAKLLGGEADDQVDPETQIKQAIAERDAALAEARDLKLTTGVARAAAALRVDAELVTAYLRGTGKLGDLDPADPEFPSQVEELITAAVKHHPQLSTPVVPTSSGNSPTPKDQDGKRRLTPEELATLARRGQWDEINAAVASGRA